MPRSLSVPDFDFTGFYYPQLLEAAIKWMRVNVPEISSESPNEPAIQLLRAYALIGHLNNVLLDQVAHESMFTTAQLRESLVSHLKLIGFKVPADVPATVEVLVTLAKKYSTSTTVVLEDTRFATKRTSTLEPIIYEANADITVSRTDQLTKVLVYDDSAGTYTDITTEMNTDSSTAALLPSTPAAGDILYIGHDTTMTDRLNVDGITAAMADVTVVLEYCDSGYEDALADSVTVVGAGLKVIIDSLLDTDGTISYAGLSVRVFYNQTGEFEDLTSEYDGVSNTNYVTTTSYLGQTSPSTTASDYTVGSQWHRVDGVDDDTNDGNNPLEVDGNIDFLVPQTRVDDWEPIAVNGTTCYWLRYRVTAVAGSPTPPTADRIHWNKRNTYVLSTATQGVSRVQDPLASSDGAESQQYTLSTTPVIEDSVEAYVNSVQWTQVDNFLNSDSLDTHYVVDIDSDGAATVTFGDGTNGKIPPAGVNNIKVEYRTDADQDGNVGPGKVIVNRSGSSNVKKVTNPRSASGWKARRGATAQDRELLKVEGPASIRTLGRAVTTADIEYLAVQFKTADGRQPIVRASAVEDFYGAKTIGLFVVGTSGSTVSIADRQELETYFNGDAASGVEGVLVLNYELTCDNYTAVPIDVTLVASGGDKDKITAALNNLLDPLAKLDDGITYRWAFGEDVPVSRIISAVLGCDVDTGGVRDVTVNTPSGTTSIGTGQLPDLGTTTITVTT
jgi:predicted phage baseplate assembly protein